MTNIEFLVNELRKANETIEYLQNKVTELREENDMVIARNIECSKELRELKGSARQNVNLGDIDALAALKKAMEQN